MSDPNSIASEPEDLELIPFVDPRYAAVLEDYDRLIPQTELAISNTDVAAFEVGICAEYERIAESARYVVEWDSDDEPRSYVEALKRASSRDLLINAQLSFLIQLQTITAGELIMEPGDGPVELTESIFLGEEVIRRRAEQVANSRLRAAHMLLTRVPTDLPPETHVSSDQLKHPLSTLVPASRNATGDFLDELLTRSVDREQYKQTVQSAHISLLEANGDDEKILLAQVRMTTSKVPSYSTDELSVAVRLTDNLQQQLNGMLRRHPTISENPFVHNFLYLRQHLVGWDHNESSASYNKAVAKFIEVALKLQRPQA